jgi:hypothetical protein
VNTARTALIEIAVPAHVSDQDLANRMRRVIAQACRPDPGDLVYPDPASLEVTVYGCPRAQLTPSQEG